MQHLLVVLGLVVSGLVCACSARAAAPALASIWAVDDGEKIFREDTRNPLKSGQDNSVWNGKQVKLFAARNETVAFQLILQAGPAGAKDVDVRVSDLVLGKQKIRGSHPLLPPNDSRGLGVELFTEHYLHVKTPSYNDPKIGGWAWTVAANPRLTGWIPDALIPFSAKPGLGGAPFAIAPNVNQGVWVDIYVPKQLPPGAYTGTVAVTVGGKPGARLPLSLEVLDLTLPDENHFGTMVFYSDENIAARHGLLSARERLNMVLAYHRLAHRHRIELIGSGRWWDLQTALRTTLDGSAFTPEKGYDGPGVGVGNRLFSVNTYHVQFDDNEEAYRRESDQWVAWFEKHAPKVEYFLYLTDEPSPQRYAWVRERSAWIHNNPGPGKKLPVFVSRWPMKELTGAIDIWCSPVGYMDKASHEAALARGERVWLYGSYRPQSPADVIDEYGIAWRLKPWIARKHGIPRWFSWESTHWSLNHNEPERVVNPFVDPVAFSDGSLEGTNNGDGWLFYSGQDKVIPDQDRGYPGPMASIRMKMYRRGLQDIEYQWLAEQAGHRAQVAALVKKLLPKTLWDLPGYQQSQDLPTWSNRNAVYEQARRQLADWALTPSPGDRRDTHK